MKIIFVCKELYERPAKIAKYLSSLSASVDVVYQTCVDDEFLKYFSKTFKIIRSKHLSDILFSKRYEIIHHFSKAIDSFSMELLNGELDFIYDYKDIFEKLLRLPFDQDFYNIQKQLILKSKSCTFRDNQLQEFISRNGITREIQKFNLPDLILPIDMTYSSSNFDKSKGRLSICFGGNFSIEKLNPEHSGLGQLRIADAISSQNINYHLYPFRHDLADLDSKIMSQYIDLEKSNECFYLMKRLKRQEFIRAISNHTFASQIIAFNHWSDLDDMHYLIEPIVGMPSRIFDYIAAEIPIIMDDIFIEPSEYIIKNEIGIILSKNELHKLTNIIDATNYEKLKDSVIQLKKQLCLDAQKVCESLIHFYRSQL